MLKLNALSILFFICSFIVEGQITTFDDLRPDSLKQDVYQLKSWHSQKHSSNANVSNCFKVKDSLLFVCTTHSLYNNYTNELCPRFQINIDSELYYLEFYKEDTLRELTLLKPRADDHNSISELIDPKWGINSFQKDTVDWVAEFRIITINFNNNVVVDDYGIEGNWSDKKGIDYTSDTILIDKMTDRIKIKNCLKQIFGGGEGKTDLILFESIDRNAGGVSGAPVIIGDKYTNVYELIGVFIGNTLLNANQPGLNESIVVPFDISNFKTCDQREYICYPREFFKSTITQIFHWESTFGKYLSTLKNPSLSLESDNIINEMKEGVNNDSIPGKLLFQYQNQQKYSDILFQNSELINREDKFICSYFTLLKYLMKDTSNDSDLSQAIVNLEELINENNKESTSRVFDDINLTYKEISYLVNYIKTLQRTKLECLKTERALDSLNKNSTHIDELKTNLIRQTSDNGIFNELTILVDSMRSAEKIENIFDSRSKEIKRILKAPKNWLNRLNEKENVFLNKSINKLQKYIESNPGFHNEIKYAIDSIVRDFNCSSCLNSIIDSLDFDTNFVLPKRINSDSLDLLELLNEHFTIDEFPGISKSFTTNNIELDVIGINGIERIKATECSFDFVMSNDKSIYSALYTASSKFPLGVYATPISKATGQAVNNLLEKLIEYPNLSKNNVISFNILGTADGVKYPGDIVYDNKFGSPSNFENNGDINIIKNFNGDLNLNENFSDKKIKTDSFNFEEKIEKGKNNEILAALRASEIKHYAYNDLSKKVLDKIDLNLYAAHIKNRKGSNYRRTEFSIQFYIYNNEVQNESSKSAFSQLNQENLNKVYKDLKKLKIDCAEFQSKLRTLTCKQILNMKN